MSSGPLGGGLESDLDAKSLSALGGEFSGPVYCGAFGPISTFLL